ILHGFGRASLRTRPRGDRFGGHRNDSPVLRSRQRQPSPTDGVCPTLGLAARTHARRAAGPDNWPGFLLLRSVWGRVGLDAVHLLTHSGRVVRSLRAAASHTALLCRPGAGLYLDGAGPKPTM